MSTLLGYPSTAGNGIHNDRLCRISSAYYGYIYETSPTCDTFCIVVYHCQATSLQGPTCSTTDSRSSPHAVVLC